MSTVSPEKTAHATLESLSISGYRRLHSVSMPMRPLAVMIGANGSGKTSFLEVLSLLAASAQGGLRKKISDLGGMSEILTRDKADAIELSAIVRSEKPGNPCVTYSLELVSRGLFYGVGSESVVGPHAETAEPFFYLDRVGSKIRGMYDTSFHPIDLSKAPLPDETTLSVANGHGSSVNGDLRACLSSISFYRPIDVSARSPIRIPQSVQPVTRPGENGEDLVSCLYNWRETEPVCFELVEDTLHAAFPDFEKLSFPPVAAGTLAMTWKDRNFSKPLYMHQLSEGTLRFLWLTCLLLSRSLTAITLIDEPEVSLHPDMLSLLADLLRGASKKTQLIVATHSDRLIRALRPAEVLICDTEDGLSKLTWGDSPDLDLERWMKDYTLDELWSMNILGGRPCW